MGGLWHRDGPCRKVAANPAPQFWSVAATFAEFDGVVKQLMRLQLITTEVKKKVM